MREGRRVTHLVLQSSGFDVVGRGIRVKARAVRGEGRPKKGKGRNDDEQKKKQS
jgi:hypothetical protein